MADAGGLQSALLLSLLAGASIPVGGFLATISRIHPRWLDTSTRHGIMAFGGGALLSAVALVLVPEGAGELPLFATLGCFAAGGVGFYYLDRVLDRTGSPGALLAAMMADFLPEAVALGAALAAGEGTAVLLAALIALQNVPEAFNAQRELASRSSRERERRWLLIPLALLGPAAAAVGFLFLVDLPAVLGGVMLVASGGILYVVFQDVAPAAHVKHRGAPALGAVLGFLLGLAGYLMTGG